MSAIEATDVTVSPLASEVVHVVSGRLFMIVCRCESAFDRKLHTVVMNAGSRAGSLAGRVLDLGCGLGNLAVAAARRGCPVFALDASTAAIERIRRVASAEALPIEARVADLAAAPITEQFDVIVAIGLLMFMERRCARRLLKDIQSHVAPNGLAVSNVLIEGTTFLDMFEPGRYYLFGRNELPDQFARWEILESRYDDFAAPGPSLKKFATVIARKSAP